VCIYTGLDAGVFPPSAQASPFLDRKTPPVQPQDPERTFARALRAASERVLIRSAHLPPSRLWPAGQAPASRWRSATSRIERTSLRQKARLGIRDPRVDPVLARTERRTIGSDYRHLSRTGYSVTELEQFISCPYGWFVRYVLRPQTLRESARAEQGSYVHHVCDQLFSLDASERAARLDEIWQSERTRSVFSPATAEVYHRRISALLERYGGSAWPWSRHLTEVPLEGKILPSMPHVTITGRADRIDVGDPGLLVIDYKNRKALARPSASVAVSTLLDTLYPLLAPQTLGTDPYGMIYISVFHCDHAGQGVRPLGELDNRNMLFGPLHERQQAALEAAADAIARIEAGDVDQVGRGCPAWCAHRLISATGRSR
jgi:RecB family exonuclease